MDVTGNEMIINRKEMALQKVEKIRSGYSAFAETKELIDLIKKELLKENIEVKEEITEIGTWFIPVQKRE